MHVHVPTTVTFDYCYCMKGQGRKRIVYRVVVSLQSQDANKEDKHRLFLVVRRIM